MASEHQHRWPVPEDAPAGEDLSRCVHCGLCLTSCPTYVVTGLEMESPRGRIYLARGVDEARIPLTAAVEKHWDLCLQCRACEAVCPSGVAYGRIIEHVRAQTAAAPLTGGTQRRFRRFVLRNVVARPSVLHAVCLPARWLAASSVRPLIERLRLPRKLREAVAPIRQLPSRPGARFEGERLPAGTAGDEPSVAFFGGCVMNELFGNVHRATVRVLEAAGLAVSYPRGQGCCGALHGHDGDLAFARERARATIAAFEQGPEATVVVNSAGCGAAMKEYHELLADDHDWAARATAFSARVKDFSEVLSQQGGIAGLKLRGSAAYQDACHLAHAQRIRQQPRDALASVEGLTCIETPGNDLCCGAAGIYSIVQPGMSAELRKKKADAFRAANPDYVVTANPGCQMQYESATREAGVKARIMHLAELLDEALPGSGR
ncbi:MAG: (Fe-S)-binding protein [Dehalococcoidia bacterium]